MAVFSNVLSGSHGGRSIDVTQTGSNTHAVAQASDLSEVATFGVTPRPGAIIVTGFAPSVPRFTNGFASAPFISFSTGDAGADSIFLSKVTLTNAATVKAVVMNVPNLASSISFKALVYDGSHSALLGAAATVTSLAAGYNRFALTADLSLSAGTYYVGYACNSSLTVSIDPTQTGNNWFVSGGQSVTTPANPLSGGATNSAGLCIGLEFSDAGADYGFAQDFTNGTVLSAANTIATFDAARAEGARSIVTHIAGDASKSYAEVVVSGPISSNSVVALYAACASLDNPSTTTSNKIGEFLTLFSGTATGSTVVSTGLAFSAGDVAGVAYDAATGNVWFNKNNGAWVGNGASPNPATGASGIAVAAGNWPVMIGAAANLATIFTLRDTADRQSYAPPSGYSAWSSGSSGIAPAPGVGSLVFTGFAPSLVLSIAVAPGAGSLVFTGLAPSTAVDAVLTPSAGAIVFTGLAPTSTIAVAPSTGSMSLTGFAPTPLALLGSNVFFHSVF